jgi:hypothetical protein
MTPQEWLWDRVHDIETEKLLQDVFGRMLGSPALTANHQFMVRFAAALTTSKNPLMQGLIPLAFARQFQTAESQPDFSRPGEIWAQELATLRVFLAASESQQRAILQASADRPVFRDLSNLVAKIPKEALPAVASVVTAPYEKILRLYLSSQANDSKSTWAEEKYGPALSTLLELRTRLSPDPKTLEESLEWSRNVLQRRYSASRLGEEVKDSGAIPTRDWFRNIARGTTALLPRIESEKYLQLIAAFETYAKSHPMEAGAGYQDFMLEFANQLNRLPQGQVGEQLTSQMRALSRAWIPKLSPAQRAGFAVKLFHRWLDLGNSDVLEAFCSELLGAALLSLKRAELFPAMSAIWELWGAQARPEVVPFLMKISLHPKVFESLEGAEPLAERSYSELQQAPLFLVAQAQAASTRAVIAQYRLGDDKERRLKLRSAPLVDLLPNEFIRRAVVLDDSKRPECLRASLIVLPESVELSILLEAAKRNLISSKALAAYLQSRGPVSPDQVEMLSRYLLVAVAFDSVRIAETLRLPESSFPESFVALDSADQYAQLWKIQPPFSPSVLSEVNQILLGTGLAISPYPSRFKPVEHRPDY